MLETITTNWPVILIVLAGVIIATGLVKKLAKLAFFGVGVAVIGIVLWPIVSDFI